MILVRPGEHAVAVANALLAAVGRRAMDQGYIDIFQ